MITHSISLSPQQARALDIIIGGENVFLSGMAGTGKSTITGILVSGRHGATIDLCATTGIAAINLAQQILERTGFTRKTYTIYSFAGIMLGPHPGQSFESYTDWLDANMTRSRLAAFNRIRRAEVIVIDEVSMLPGRLFDFLDYLFRRIRMKPEIPFGGVQIVAVGDFLQLPPVSKNQVYDWAFNSAAWKGAGFRNCYLTEIFRQTEPRLVNALNDFRIGRISGDTATLLGERIAKFPKREWPRLMTHNTQVNNWNAVCMGAIEAHPAFTLNAQTAGPELQVEFLLKNVVTPAALTLKISARVMFTANIRIDGEMIAANGECGEVLEVKGGDGPTGFIDSLDKENLVQNPIRIRKDNGREIWVGRHTWSFDPQDENSATFVQYPLRLAYAMTIHKSQGLTLTHALIDIRAAREPGQAYVALSRIKSIEGLHIKDMPAGVFISPEAIQLYRDIEKNNALSGL